MTKNLCYHSHSFFCDGKNSIDQMVQSAFDKGMAAIGISSHAPLKIENPWSLKLEETDNYYKEIDQAKIKYSNKIMVFKSLEIDFIPGLTYDFDFFRKGGNLDYTIGSIHLVLSPQTNKIWFIDGEKKQCIDSLQDAFNGNVRMAIEQFYAQTREMILQQKPTIIGHLDKVMMHLTDQGIDTQSDWYLDQIEQTLNLIKLQGCIVEVNTRGIYRKKHPTTFPSPDILKQMLNREIPIVISTDAHHVDDLTAEYQSTRLNLIQMGFRHQSYFDGKTWTQIDL